MTTNPYDEQNIGASDVVIRRINPREHVVWDHVDSCQRISSKAYCKSTGATEGMSVDIEALIIAGGHKPREYVISPPFAGAVSFAAAQIRRLDLWVGYDPVKNHPQHSDNPYHGQVWRNTPGKHFTGAQRKGLHNCCPVVC